MCLEKRFSNHWLPALCVAFVFGAGCWCCQVAAQETSNDNTITIGVIAARVTPTPSIERIETRLKTSDPGELLSSVPGLYRYSGGGISSLPVLHGLNDERVGISIDGAPVSSACGNHMNPPLSYLNLASANVLSPRGSVPPVSAGGDNLVGTLAIASQPPIFAEQGEHYSSSTEVFSSYRGNGDGIAEGVAAALANQNLNLSYAGNFTRSTSYRDAHGDKVRSTQYAVWNHTMTLAARDVGNLFQLKGNLQEIPYQGYVNQYMDMVNNRAKSLVLSDDAELDWGKISARAFYQDIHHDMGFFSEEKVGEMPMNVKGKDLGYSLGAEIELGALGALRAGNELRRFELDDRWPAVPGSMMMGPNTYVNINDGKRQLIDNYIEWEYQLAADWKSVVGVRQSLVTTSAGDAQPYESPAMQPMSQRMMGSGMPMMPGPDAAAAQAFNLLDHHKQNTNLDMSASLQYEPRSLLSAEFGYTRKNRAPNLYERYAWGRSTMAMTMIGWFGDANGYVGDLDLRPETANTVSATVELHDQDRECWMFRLSPYFTYVQNYIDVDPIGEFNPRLAMGDTKSLLQFANHDARIFGFDLNAALSLWRDSDLGDGRLVGSAAWIHGERVDSGESLYHMMPFNGRVALEHSLGSWLSSFELEAVDNKSRVDPLRRELKTPGFLIANLMTSYGWENVRVDFGLANLFDTFYYLPLGGVDYADWQAEGAVGSMGSVPGAGRSVNVGVTVKF